ncbi:MAG TPA: MaoC family dehydratase N-terminal domain-containing protein [Candidatus Nanopelagicaceae bacterium]|nr:MaoC family dehydratase N-terminal domain-containing protein [Candidatus Nanopelagicaceae bacterium]
MDIEEMKKNAGFLIKNVKGIEIPGSATVNVRYKTLVNFAKVYGITDSKYVGSEEDGIVACHGFANHFTIKAVYKLLIGFNVVQDGKTRGIMLDLGKLLHTGNIYSWEGCVDVKPGDKLQVTGSCEDVWLNEKNMMLFYKFLVNVTNQNEEPVCDVVITAGVRKGGY